MDIKQYFAELLEDYGGQVSLGPADERYIEEIPDMLKPLYTYLSKASLPFGTIFSIEQAMERSKAPPFSPHWFVFGKDHYFSFWLCSYSKDDEGLSFTSWDHDSGADIDGAVYEDVVSFLQDAHEEQIEFADE